MDTIIKQATENFAASISRFEEELSGLRTGRAHAGLLATVQVDSYGQLVPLNHVANVSVADAQTLVVTPWDRGQMPAVEKGILAANLGLTPSNDGTLIRISVPAMTEERRKEMVKVLGQMAEKARIAIRNSREDLLKAVKKQESDGAISKDDLKGVQEDMQKVVDEANSKVKELTENKEKEIMTV